MHELKIIQDIFPLIEKAAQDNQLKSITKVTLSVGKLHQIQNKFLHFAFTTIAQDTIATTAELVIKTVPVTIFCLECRKRFTVQDNIYLCPKCNNTNFELLTGKEIVLESIDGEK
jgi:hydrogenase nickel incorporation protein HypA/HybF